MIRDSRCHLLLVQLLSSNPVISLAHRRHLAVRAGVVIIMCPLGPHHVLLHDHLLRPLVRPIVL